MVAIDTNTGSAVRVGGAALASGPALSIPPNRRSPDAVRGVAGGLFPDGGSNRSRQIDPQTAPYAGVELATREVLPATWAAPAYFVGAPYGPPYELPNRMAEWELSADTLRYFKPTNRSSKMALRVHPRGPELVTPGAFLSNLYGLTPAPAYVGVGLDTWM